MTSRDLVLVVPCYNEARRLRGQEFVAFVRSHPGVRFLFVDDGSSDGTGAVHAELVKCAPGDIDALRLERNQGKAEAVRQGILQALRSSPRLVGFWDADLATPLDAVEDFLKVADKCPDVEMILGSRVHVDGSRHSAEGVAALPGRVFATAASLTLGIPVYDTQCGAKVFRATSRDRRRSSRARSAARGSSTSRSSPATWISRTMAGRPAPARIYELAVPAWHDVPGSKVRPSRISSNR